MCDKATTSNGLRLFVGENNGYLDILGTEVVPNKRLNNLSKPTIKYFTRDSSAIWFAGLTVIAARLRFLSPRETMVMTEEAFSYQNRDEMSAPVIITVTDDRTWPVTLEHRKRTPEVSLFFTEFGANTVDPLLAKGGRKGNQRAEKGHLLTSLRVALNPNIVEWRNIRIIKVKGTRFRLVDTVAELHNLFIEIQHAHNRLKSKAQRWRIISLDPATGVAALHSRMRQHYAAPLSETARVPDNVQDVKCGESELIVARTMWTASGIDGILKRLGKNVVKKPYLWNDEILKRIAVRNVDIAIYNRIRAQHFFDNHRLGNRIQVGPSCGKSMNGMNLYLLGLKEIYHDSCPTLASLKEAIKGRTIFLPKASDILDTLKVALEWDDDDFTAAGVKFVPLDSELAALGLGIFSRCPEALYYNGQNVRALAMLTPEYVEVLGQSTLSPESWKKLEPHAENCFVLNQQFSREIGFKKLASGLEKNIKRFPQSLLKPGKAWELLSRIAQGVVIPGAEGSDKITTVAKILEKTYNFKIPI